MEAYTQSMIENEAVWHDMIEMPNRISHTYDESEVSELLDKLVKYEKAFTLLKNILHKNWLTRSRVDKLAHLPRSNT